MSIVFFILDLEYMQVVDKIIETSDVAIIFLYYCFHYYVH